MSLTRLVCAIFMLYQNVFCYFFKTAEEGKSDNDNDFKIYCSRTILDSAKQTKCEIFEIRIFSHPLSFFHFYLMVLTKVMNELKRSKAT